MNHLLIKKQDAPKGEFRDELEVQYNPERYSIERSGNWAERTKHLGALEYNGEGRKSITFELFFDSYETQKDVRGEYVQKLVALMEPTVALPNGKKRPPVLMLSWGSLVFKGILEKVSQNYTMFLETGVPVRAVVNATFLHYIPPDQASRGNPPGDPTKVHRVKEGETLNLIADQAYGDPSLWRVIAAENKLSDPMRLQPGSLLILPALE